MLQNLPNNWAQINAEDLNAELAQDGELVLIDVRTAEEVAENGAIESAVNIPLEMLFEVREEWPPREAEVVVYDTDGYRGNLAMTLLRSYGYGDAHNLRNGLTAWIDEGLPLVTE